MIVQKEFANNPFGHGDLHALPYPRHKATFYKLLRRSENVILKTIYVLTNPFGVLRYNYQTFPTVAIFWVQLFIVADA